MRIKYGGKYIAHLGNMYAGKTDGLINDLKQYRTRQIKCIALKLKGDNRYSKECEICSRHGNTFPALEITLAEADAMLEQDEEIMVIGIDEMQMPAWGTPDEVLHYVKKWKIMGLTIVCSMLNGDFKQHAFPNVVALLPEWDKTVQHRAFCCHEGCFKKCIYTGRTTQEQELEVIGGADKYVSLCLKHLVQHQENQNKKN